MRLGRRQHGCLHSTGSAALEELHLPPETDSECECFKQVTPENNGLAVHITVEYTVNNLMLFCNYSFLSDLRIFPLFIL